jgi:uncharacterized hydrophobic protein (TIGR00271 family)
MDGHKNKIMVKEIFSLHEDAASHEEIRDRLLAGGRVTGTNMIVMICAIGIASVCLNMNSTAVIIGAMLISPLMGSLLAMAYGSVSGDLTITENHTIGFIFQVFASIIAATVYFLLSPVKEATPEIIARTNPTFYDVIVALFGGVAGIIGQTRKDKANNIVPGVAIATALMPPLCVCGYSLARCDWAMLGGAAYLFLVNAYFIFMSASMILTLLKIPRVRELTEKQWKRRKRIMIRNTIIIIIPSIVYAVGLVA